MKRLFALLIATFFIIVLVLFINCGLIKSDENQYEDGILEVFKISEDDFNNIKQLSTNEIVFSTKDLKIFKFNINNNSLSQITALTFSELITYEAPHDFYGSSYKHRGFLLNLSPTRKFIYVSALYYDMALKIVPEKYDFLTTFYIYNFDKNSLYKFDKHSFGQTNISGGININDIYYTRLMPGEEYIWQCFVHKYNFIDNKETDIKENSFLEDISEDETKILYKKWEKDNRFIYKGLILETNGSTYKLESKIIGELEAGDFIDIYARISPSGNKVLSYYKGNISIFENNSLIKEFKGTAPAFNHNGSKLLFFNKSDDYWVINIYNFVENKLEENITITDSSISNSFINCSVW